MDKQTGRVEAFSDGVFAIAITLLVLEFHVPELEHSPSDQALWSALLQLWPSLIAFLFSFFVILVIWINHHEFMRWVREVDYPFLFANGLVLLLVTFVPFPTAVVARYLNTDAARGAVALYCGTFLGVSLAFNVLFAVVARQRRLVHDHVPDEALARVRRAYMLGAVIYALSLGLSLWHPVVGLGVCASLWVLWSRLCYGATHRRATSAGA